MSGKSSKRPRPSYEEDQLRDPSIEKKIDPNYKESDLLALIKKAAKGSKAPGGA